MMNRRRFAHQKHTIAMVLSRVGSFAGEGKSRSEGGKKYNAATKPAPGFKTHPTHYAPRP